MTSKIIEELPRRIESLRGIVCGIAMKARPCGDRAKRRGAREPLYNITVVMLLSNLVVWYLFLGGLGGGSYVVAFTIGAIARLHPESPVARLVSLRPTLLIVSLSALALGTLCLVKDLAKPHNASALFISPSFSTLSIGALALGALIACVAALAVEEFSDSHPISRAIGNAPLSFIRAASCVLALVVATYTGVYLYQMPAVPLWNSIFVPALFLLSALSIGIGALFLAQALAPRHCPHARPMRSFFVADAAIIVCEAAIVLLFIAGASADPFVRLSVEALLTGRCAQRFLIGFVACGIAVPFAMELFMFVSQRHSRLATAIAGGCIVVGGFFLRLCLVDAGMHVSALMFAGA